MKIKIDNYDKLPLSFQANQGQSTADVKFLARGSGYELFLTSAEAVLLLRQAADPQIDRDISANRTCYFDRLKPASDEKMPAKIRLKLNGANKEPQLTGLDELPGRVNYFIGSDPAEWHSDIPTYARVQYRDVYPGVDMVYYGNQCQLEWDFIVQPGADPTAIILDIQGSEQLAVDDQGKLLVKVGEGEVCLCKPFVYQNIDEQKTEVSGSYVLNSQDQISFYLGDYDKTKPLVIDPVLSYSSYLGGTDNDYGRGIAVDSFGNAYVTGSTLSAGTISPPGFPAVNPIQDDNNGIYDVFVSKLNASGTALLYSTYLGGSNEDVGFGIAVDSSGNAYVTGHTRSSGTSSPSGFPTVNPIQADNNGDYDVFVSKLNASGTALLYSTYLGGSNIDRGFGIAVDSSGNAYVTGHTRSSGTSSPSGFPTMNPIQADNNGDYDVFVSKLNASGTALLYSTYLGGSNEDVGCGIAVDSSANAYVTGYTESAGTISPPGFPVMNPIQADNNGIYDVFVSKLNASGTALIYSTYLGGSNADVGCGIAVDSSANAYVTGYTESAGTISPPGFPTINPIQADNNGDCDVFVSKLNVSGTALLYSTYLGGSNEDIGNGIAVDSSANAYVTGHTYSSSSSPPGFPTMNPIQADNNGRRNVFVSRLNASGTALIYSTYLGGNNSDVGYGIAVDSSGNAYVTGFTGSSGTSSPPGFPTMNPIQPNNNGGHDAFVLKISPDITPARGIYNLSRLFPKKVNNHSK